MKTNAKLISKRKKNYVFTSCKIKNTLGRVRVGAYLREMGKKK